MRVFPLVWLLEVAAENMIIAGWVVVGVTGGEESIGGGLGAVRGPEEELERGLVEEGACGCCAGSVDCGIESEREGRIEGFKKPLGKASAITFLSPLSCSMVQSNGLSICCHLACCPMRSYRLWKAFSGLWALSIVKLHPVSMDLNCSNASRIARSPLSHVE